MNPDFKRLSPKQAARYAAAFLEEGNLEYAQLLWRYLKAAAPDNAQFARLAEALAKRGPARAALPERVKNKTIRELYESGNFVEAARLAGALAAVVPGRPALLNLLAMSLAGAKEFESAISVYRQLLLSLPDNPVVLNNLGNALKEMKRYDEAQDCFEQAVSVKPEYATAHFNLASVLQDRGDFKGAIDRYRRAIGIEPRYAEAHSNLLFVLNFDLTVPMAEKVEAARAFRAQACLREERPRPPLKVKPGEKLKIGFVSPDFRNHPVGYFLAGFLGFLPDHDIDAFLYNANLREDSMTARLAGQAAGVRDIARLDDATAYETVRADGVDILIDLAGHTGLNRLPLFAWRPAPVQATWMGYFATTGMREMDFVIGDRHVTPFEDAPHFVERIVHIDNGYLCCSKPDISVAVEDDLAFARTGHVTFGSFSNPLKAGPEVADAWARVLRAVGNSRLLLKSSRWREAKLAGALIERLADAGITKDRIHFEETSPRAEYLAAYNRIDIVLDTFPYMGGTTTAEALWMGVPVVALRGRNMFSRIGVSILNRAGRGEWVADSIDDYVDRAVALAGRVGRGELPKSRLGARLRASDLFDGGKFAADFARCARDMVERTRQFHGA